MPEGFTFALKFPRAISHDKKLSNVSEETFALLDALRSRGVEAPIYVSVASYCRGRSSPTIASAQAGLVSAAKGIRAGPDSDAISEALDRHDGCHFSARGLDRFAAAWVAALTAPAPDR